MTLPGPGTDPVAGNRRLWDELTPIHLGSRFYDVSSFKQGRSTLRRIELAEVAALGGVEGRDLLHLQCHFGLDTLSWARLGARATGLDLSEPAIAAARALAAELGIGAEFVSGDVLDPPPGLAQRFDVVFSSYGAVFWLPDIRRWAEVVASCLRPGGFAYLVDFHPVIAGFGDTAPPTMEWPYFWQADPVEWRQEGTYADPSAEVKNRSYQWNHPVGDVVSALLGAGLTVELLHEHPSSPEPLRTWQLRDDEGWWRAPHDTIPALYSVGARKPAR